MRIFCWVAVPLFLGIASFLTARGSLTGVWFSGAQGRPVIEYPATVDLGEQEMGELVVGRFAITNRGGADLIVDRIQTNCSCTGMEREHEGRYERVESLRLKANEKADLAVRVSVRGVPVDAAMHNVIEFQTNDPIHPTGRIEVVVRRVRGGVSVSPPSLIFGTIPVGTAYRQILEVRDAAAKSGSVIGVTAIGTPGLTARLLPVEDVHREGPLQPGSTLIGRVEVVVDAKVAGPVSGEIRIQLTGKGRPPDAIKVAGNIAAPVEMRPSALVLPRQTAHGLVYTAQALCRSTDGMPLTLTVDDVPPGLTVEVLAGGSESSRIIRVSLDPETSLRATDGQQQTLRLLAKSGDKDTMVELPVRLRR